jgi:thioredoxin family protein
MRGYRATGANTRCGHERTPAPAREQRRASLKESAARPSLLFFQSTRSGRCRRVEGFLAQVLQHRRNHDTFAIRRIDCDQRPDLAERFGIGRLPTMIVVESRVMRSRLEQPGGCREIEQFLRPWLR